MIQEKKIIIVLITLMLTSLTIAADANDVNNIIVNSGFEAGNFWGYHYAMYAAFKSGVPGDANFNGPSAPGTSCVLMKGKPNYPLANIRTFQYCIRPGKKYVAHWDYKSEPSTGAGTATAHLRFMESATGLAASIVGTVDINLPNSGGTWAINAVSMVAPPGTEAVDVLFDNIDGWVKFDNIVVYEENPGPPPSALAMDINDSIIINPDFEIFDPCYTGEPNLSGTSWFSSNGNTQTCLSDSYPDGNNCAQMTRAPSALMADVRSPAYPVDGGNERLAISFSYKTLPGMTGLGFAQLRFWRSSDVSGIGHLNEISWALPPTNGQWVTLRSCCIHPPAEATYVDFRFGMSSEIGADWGNGVGTLRLDNVILVNTTSKGDISCNCHVDSIDLGRFTSHWLDNESSSEVQLAIDDFEFYANQTALDVNWSMITGSEPDRGTGSLTLLTNPGDVYEGNRALRFDYNNTYHGEPNTRTEFRQLFSSPIDINEYDELRVWIKRHGGNSEENILYFKLYNGGTTPEFIQLQHHLHWVDGSTYADPNQWVELVADLHENPDTEFINGVYSQKELTNVRGIIFGCESDIEHAGGTGTIDFDRIVLINYPEGDLNKDGKVNFADFAQLAIEWLTVFEN